MKKKLLITTIVVAALMMNLSIAHGLFGWMNTPSVASAEMPGKDGSPTINSPNTIVNKYGRLTADAAAGSTKITVGTPPGPHGLDPATLTKGDLLMLIQVQGAQIDATDTVDYGRVIDYRNAGRYELIGVLSVSGNEVTLSANCNGLRNSYTASGKVQVIKVPQYGDLTLSAGASLTAPPWDGQSGGVVVVDVAGTAVINGSIDVSGLGLRGGALSSHSEATLFRSEYRSTNIEFGAEKGESIAGFGPEYDALYSGRYSRGAAANGGGGGDTHNSGGGGGANGQNGKAWTGQGVMDGTVTGASAWTLDPGCIANGNALTESTGGGRGGYSIGIENADALIVPPGDSAWNKDFRREVGGLGGRPVPQDTAGRLFFGGGGGAGTQNNDSGGAGGNAGGVIFLRAVTVNGGGTLRANGANGQNSRNENRDAPGGGGAGGSIVVASKVLSGIGAQANGGAGGTHLQPLGIFSNESHGPGGGGGGGFIAYMGGAITAEALGGANGVSNSVAITEFPSNGATRGAPGAIETSIAALPACAAKSDISVTKTNNVTVLARGQVTTYVITVKNNGPGDLTDVDVKDIPPAVLTNVSWTCTATAGSSCQAASGTGSIFTKVWLLNGGSATFLLTGTVDPAATGRVINTAMGTPAPGTDDPDPGNNMATDDDPIVDPGTPQFSSANMGVRISSPDACYGGGKIVDFDVRLTNRGDGDQPNNPGPEFTATFPGQITGLPGTCVSSAGTCTVSPNGVELNGVIPAGQTVTLTFQARIRQNTAVGQQLCTDFQVNFDKDLNGSNESSATATRCIVTDCASAPCVGPNCPDMGPGIPLPELPGTVGSDQRPGSILIFPYYTSDPINSVAQNTRINITNTDVSNSAFLHLFFVDGATCSSADSFLCLTPNQTTSFLMSDLDPGVSGYLVAVAVDSNGCPTEFNSLIGDEYVKLASGHRANLPAEGVVGIDIPPCAPGDVSAVLQLDGVQYSMLGRTLAADNLPSPLDGNSTLLVLDRIAGNLGQGTSPIGSIFGLLYNDTEVGYSFSFSNPSCQLRATLNASFPRSVPRYTEIIPAGRTGWMKFSTISGPTEGGGLVGALLNFNADPNGFNGGHNLHKLTLSPTSLTIPIFTPSCQ
jgi:uncharacterized repeat protein (TIGR01451 family)